MGVHGQHTVCPRLYSASSGMLSGLKSLCVDKFPVNLSVVLYMTMVSKKTKAFIIDLLTDVLIVVVLVLVIRQFVYAPFRVDGSSMCSTFNMYEDECNQGSGELILTSRFPTWSIFGFSFSNIDRGDVIVFRAPYSEEKEFYIKRVIGMPGDTIKIADGLVYLLNEEGDYIELTEDYLNEDNAGNTNPYHRTEMIYEVPEETFFVLGDNRQVSQDSRRCFQSVGCEGDRSSYLDEDLVQGKVRVVIFPLSHIRWISDYDYSL
jgi:signal peptidase I